MKIYEHRCEQEVFAGTWENSARCEREGKVLEEDKWVCAQHSSKARASRRAEADRRYEAKAAARRARDASNAAGALVPELLAALPDPQKLRNLISWLDTDVAWDTLGAQMLPDLRRWADGIEAVKERYHASHNL